MAREILTPTSNVGVFPCETTLFGLLEADHLGLLAVPALVPHQLPETDLVSTNFHVYVSYLVAYKLRSLFDVGTPSPLPTPL